MTDAPGLTLDNTHLSEASQATSSPSRGVQLIANPAIDCLRRVETFVADSLAPNTKRAYLCDLEHFRSWGADLPASPETLASYLAAHADTLSVATMVRRMASISKAHKARGFANPASAELVRATMRSIKRTRGCAQRQAKPLLRDDLLLVLDAMGDSLKDARDRALLLLGFAGGLRRSELVGLDLADIDRVRQGIVLHLRRSKTDQEGHGQKIGIPHGRTRCCPVAALDAWLAASRITEGAVFRPVDRHGRVQYVKICSLYGAGFYYIPGTDMCLKVGGWVRAEYAYGGGNSMTTGPFAAGYNARTTNNDFVMRTRGYITMDARNQSEYGTIRSYIAVGVNYDSPAGSTFSSNRAFIQLAGFTFGTTQSFFDFYSSPATAYWGGAPSSDTGDPGWKVAAYTAQFGNGLSSTLSVEEPRTVGVVDADGRSSSVISLNGTSSSYRTSTPFSVLGTLPGSALTGNNAAGQSWPDLVANLRIDQAWGSAQVMGALHNASGGYYTSDSGSMTGATANGNPSNVIGFAVGAGLKLNAPMIGQGDYFQSQVNYTQGAMRYASFTENGTASPFSWNGSGTGGSVGYGWVTDGVFAGTTTGQTAVQLTTAWVVDAAYEHFWNKQWRTSLYGGYLGVSYNATANAAICVNGSTLAGGQTSAGGLSGFSGTCNNNWGQWWLGSRTQWNVTPDTYLGLDVLYQDLLSANSGQTATYAAVSQTPQPAGVVNIADQHAWSFRFRVHKDFYP